MSIRNHDSSHFSLDWELGSCYGPKSLEKGTIMDYGYESYFDRCCLPSGRHVLICHNRLGPFGWGESSIEILGHRYCNDFVGYKALRKLELSGKYNLLINHRSVKSQNN